MRGAEVVPPFYLQQFPQFLVLRLLPDAGQDVQRLIVGDAGERWLHLFQRTGVPFQERQFLRPLPQAGLHDVGDELLLYLH